jgi:hypothetical protein
MYIQYVRDSTRLTRACAIRSKFEDVTDVNDFIQDEQMKKTSLRNKPQLLEESRRVACVDLVGVHDICTWTNNHRIQDKSLLAYSPTS